MHPEGVDDVGITDTVITPRPDDALSATPPADPAIPHDDTVIIDRAPERGDREPVEPRTASAIAAVEPAAGSAATSTSARAPRQPEPARTPTYRFRVNAHEPILLDTPVLIGRRPSGPRVSVGRLPRLVRVPSPLREVSSTHLELRQQAGLVVVTDLRSTNGTLVTIPGAIPVKLRQGESVVVSAGAVVDIGDGNVVEILPFERIQPTETSVTP